MADGQYQMKVGNVHFGMPLSNTLYTNMILAHSIIQHV
jgi:hypothetical protein